MRPGCPGVGGRKSPEQLGTAPSLIGRLLATLPGSERPEAGAVALSVTLPLGD